MSGGRGVWTRRNIGANGEASIYIPGDSAKAWGDPTVIQLTDGMFYILRGDDKHGTIGITWDVVANGSTRSGRMCKFSSISGPFPTLDDVKCAWLVMYGEV